MAEFSDELVEKAWNRSEGRCECDSRTHGHIGRCLHALLKNRRGDRGSLYCWEAHSISGYHLNSDSDCKIYCWEPCHRLTL